jgi:hypothetical protein
MDSIPIKTHAGEKNMQRSIITGIGRLATAFMFIALLTGCTHTYVARQVPVPSGQVPRYAVPHPVKLTNAQDSSEPSMLGQQGFHKYVGDLQKWTDTALRVMKKELESRGMAANAGAAKEIKLTVDNANVHWGFATIRCIVRLKVETGDGYVNTFEGNAASGWTLFKACDAAVARSVAKALSDPKVMGYITK